MQDLYYKSGSGITSSLVLFKEDNTINSWTNINSLIVCGSLLEIMAFSSSQNIVSFPIGNTNLYYGIGYSDLFPSPTPYTASFYGKLNWNFNFTHLDPDYIYANYPTYYISSSANSIYIIGSGSSNTGSISATLPTGSYTLALTSSNGSFPSSYTSSITVYESITGSLIPGNLGNIVLNLTKSSNVPLTASLFISASRIYTAYLFISGTYAT